MTKIRKVHRILGIVMILPFLIWASTGLIFFLKPGYGSAYETLRPKTYPLSDSIVVKPDSTWLEFSLFKSIIGHHLIIRTKEGQQHLDPATMSEKTVSLPELRLLFEDAFTSNPDRYGEITDLNDVMVTTSTGVRIKVDWTRLTFYQRGRDTDQIDALYRMHYLQWTGYPIIDKIIGLAGICLIFGLTYLGFRLASTHKAP